MIKQYIRNKKGHPIGVLVGTPDGIGWSLCCKKDNWDRERGVDIATSRARNFGVRFPKLPHSIQEDYNKFVKRCSRYFKKK